jgi:alkaline phosphatase
MKLSCIGLLASSAALLYPSLVPVHAQTRKFKNVIMLIPDGCDDGVLGLARWYKNEPLAVDALSKGAVRPYMANSLMTDSAPGGTAYSTGELTTDKFIAVGPRREDLLSTLKEWDLWKAYAPIPTNLEAAKAMRMSTGLLSTSRVTHATPASFAAHVDARSKEKEIAKQMVFNNVDVVMGGGRGNMLPTEACLEDLVNITTSSGVAVGKQTGVVDDYSVAQPGEVTGNREDCLDLEAELKSRGYDLCYTRQELLALEAHPGQHVWCSFAESHMAADIDRKHFAETEPSLSEMTAKAIEILSQNPAGFFLMVEGSQFDWAGTSKCLI